MALTDERRASLKAYCRIDQGETEDDGLLQTFYDAAVSYLAGAGIAEPKTGDSRRAQYDLCVNHMVLDAYDHRGRTLNMQWMKENPAFRQMILHLENTKPVSNLDTGS